MVNKNSKSVVGILGVQGCIEPHEAMLDRLGISHLRVKTPQDLDLIDRIILPGGESSTMLRFITKNGLFDALKSFGKSNPTWGICAGAILLAKTVINPEQPSLGLMNIRAHRNFYGSQLDSFTEKLDVSGIDGKVEAHFIRAPQLDILKPSKAVVRSSLNDVPVFIVEDKLWATSFHVELGSDVRLHEEFVGL